MLSAPMLQETRSEKAQLLKALFIGFGIGAICVLMHSGGSQEPASTVDMAATGAMSGAMAPARLAWGLPRMPSWMKPTQSQSFSPLASMSTNSIIGQQCGGKPSMIVRGDKVMAQAEMKTITILGATGLVGQELLDLIPRAWPDAKLQLFASRERTMEYGGKSYEVKAASDLDDPAKAPKGDVAFVALDDDFSRKYVPILLDLGYRVVDKSNCYRMDPNVPLVVPGVNSDLVTDDVKLVANPNCNTIPFCLAVAPLQRKYGLKGATVSSYQAISGAGIGTLTEFQEMSKDGYGQGNDGGNRIGKQFDPTKYAGNVFPHNGGTDDSGFSSEERKMMFESRKILRLPDFDISAQCCRVPVSVGHYENAWVTFGDKVTPADAKAVLTDKKQAPFTHYKDGPVGEGVSTLNGLENRDDTLVGRVRPDPRDSTGSTLCMTVTADNLRQGAATNAVRVASCWFPSKDENLQAKCFPPA